MSEGSAAEDRDVVPVSVIARYEAIQLFREIPISVTSSEVDS